MKEVSDSLNNLGFAIIDGIYTPEEISRIIKEIENTNHQKETFRKSSDLFAIRQLLIEIPNLFPLIFNTTLKSLLCNLLGSDYFIVKSIYFDKPVQSNWYVAYHQDLTISVKQKHNLEGYGPWTQKHNQYAVQPPLSVLDDITTIRIHLDNTTSENGALKVVNGSHQKGIYRPETIDWQIETESICNVKSGGIMFMKPLLLHSSSRTTNQQRRRVIHIELSKLTLQHPIEWAEKELIFA